MKVISLYFVI